MTTQSFSHVPFLQPLGNLQLKVASSCLPQKEASSQRASNPSGLPIPLSQSLLAAESWLWEVGEWEVGLNITNI